MTADSHGTQAPAQAPAHASRKPYMVVFALLFVFTVLEIAVASPKLGVPKGPMVIALILLALTKATMVAYFFMHLKQELKPLRWMVGAPFSLPALYAVVLIVEASWRFIR